MIRTVEHYREDIKDGRDIRKDGERFKNVATHPAFKPIIDVNSCMFDTAHEPGHADAIIYRNGDKVNFIFYRPRCRTLRRFSRLAPAASTAGWSITRIRCTPHSAWVKWSRWLVMQSRR